MNPEQLAKSGSEDAHQTALFAWANMAATYGYDVAWNNLAYAGKDVAEAIFLATKHPFEKDTLAYKLTDMFAVPNGGLRHKATAGRLKATGVKSGVPDIVLPVSVGRWHGLFVELKKIGGRASPEQKDWNRRLTCNGYRVYLCEGWRMAAESIQYYLEGKDCYD